MFRLERDQIPERLNDFTGVCMVITLESMFSSILGREVVAPIPVLKSREAYVNSTLRKLEYERARFLNITNLWGAINSAKAARAIEQVFWRLVRLDEKELFETVLPQWQDLDPEIGELIRQLDFSFVNYPLWELIEMAKCGYQVGVIVCGLGSDFRPRGHIFHLGAEPNNPITDDISDFGPLRTELRTMLAKGDLVDITESLRINVGFSGLLVKPRC